MEVQRESAPIESSNIDPRVTRTRERVLSATQALLAESGLSHLTINEMSKRSGVAKTTIYRHWANRNAIVVEACERMSDDPEDPPNTGSLEGDLHAILTRLADLLTTAQWSSIMPSIIDAAERDPEIAEIQARIQSGHAAPMRATLERAQGRGEISRDTDASAVAAALRGPLYFRRWFTREPLDRDFIDVVVRGVVAGLHASA